MGLQLLLRSLAWLLIAATAAVTLSPHQVRPSTAAPADVERVLAFILISATLAFAYPKQRVSVFILAVVIAIVLELGQNLVPDRHAHIHDALVKINGSIAGALIAEFMQRFGTLTWFRLPSALKSIIRKRRS
ncbi:VanZ family protein [Microvirga sp. KLBC 81]|uniref:VanZ family protein n=1 Tax=Microvirga sp. KLBC 81 TaxID=1862707 RepID=UPI000D51EF28|nr:VanZ family protein [Microvirga sp. KLBC 81]